MGKYQQETGPDECVRGRESKLTTRGPSYDIYVKSIILGETKIIESSLLLSG